MLAPSSSSMAGRQQAEQAAAFQLLRPVMTAVLQHRQDPAAMHTALCNVQRVVLDAQPAGLAACFDYVTFPLLLVLESAAAARQPAAAAAAAANHTQDKDSTSRSHSSSGGGGVVPQAPDAVPVPAAGSDRVVEALLSCLLALLGRCPGVEHDQALSLLQRLLPLLQLPRDAASEEVRLLTWQLLRQLLATTTSAATLSSAGHAAQDATLHQQPPTVWGQDPAALAPVFGVLISSSLTAAAGEVGAPQGSREVAAAALESLQRMLVLLGPGDALAFFLPGVASGLGKVLAVTGHPVAKAQALRALAGLLTSVLGDDYVQANTPEPFQELAATAAAGWQQGRRWDALQGGGGGGDTASRVLQQLSALSLQAQHQQQQGHGSEVPPNTLATSSRNSSGGGGGGSRQDGGGKQLVERATSRASDAASGGGSRSSRPFQVVRDPAWYTTTLSKVQALLAVSLPPQMVSSSVPVRAALSEALVSLLTHCWVTLGSCRGALLEMLLTLSQDGFEQVSAPALAWLSSKQVTPAAVPTTAAAGGGGGGRTGVQQPAAAEDETQQEATGGMSTPAAVAAGVTEQEQALGMLLGQLARGCYAAVKQGEESGAAAAQRLTGLLLLADPLLVQQQLLGHAATLKPLLEDLFACFALDATGAAQLLYSRAAARQAVAYAASGPSQEVPAAPSAASGSTSSSSSEPPGGASPQGSTDGAHRQANGIAAPPNRSSSGKGAPGVASAPGPELPRMPLSLVHLTSSSSYTAVAGVARALGRCAAAADGAAGLAEHNTLRRLMDLLLTALKERLRSHPLHTHQPHTQGRKGTPSPSQPHLAAAASGWQCGAASVLCVAAEVVFGASGAWQPPAATAAAAGASGGAARVGVSRSSEDQLGELVLPLVQAVTSDKVWGVPTTQPPPTAPGAAADTIPAQVLGLNALLLRCCCDFLGACGRSLGRTFTAPGPLLRAALLPLLDRLADPVPLVADAAGAALSCICRHGGHPGGLRELVGAHADYVVDGVCKRLRDLGRYPRAPQLLAALLQEAGVAAELLPLLSEPLKAALGGLSILARRQQPTYVIPFLHILQHVSTGCQQQAAAASAALAAWQQHYQQQAEAAGLYNAGAADDGEVGNQEEQEEEEEEEEQTGPDAVAQHSRVGKFFRQHHESKAAQEGSKQEAAAERHLGLGQQPAPAAAAQENQQLPAEDPAAGLLGSRVADPVHLLPPHAHHTGHTSPHSPAAVPSSKNSGSSAGRASKRRPLPDSRKMVLHPADLEVLELLWRRAHAAATLADAAAQAAAPLLLLRSLREAVLASEVVASALSALEVSTAAVDVEEALFEELVTRGPGTQVRPVRPEVPKLLPAVHQVWGPLVACLGAVSSVPVLEAGLALLSVLVQLAGGQFMARRVYREAWPVLEPLLRTGLLHSEGAGGGTAALKAASGSSTPLLQQPGVSSALLQLEAAQKQQQTQQEQQSGAVTTTTSSSSSSGSSSRRTGPAGDDSGPAPAAMARVQAAVLQCLAGIAASSSSAAALQQLVWPLGCAASQLLGSQQQPSVREAAGKLLKALAGVDADAVWLLLVDVGQVKVQVPTVAAAAAAAGGPVSIGEPTAAYTTGTTKSAEQLPSWEQLLPARRSSATVSVHSSISSSSSIKGASKPSAADSCTPSVSEGASSRAAAVWSSLFGAAPERGPGSAASTKDRPDGSTAGGGSSSHTAEAVQQPSVRWHGRVLDYLASYHAARAELRLEP